MNTLQTDKQIITGWQMVNRKSSVIVDEKWAKVLDNKHNKYLPIYCTKVVLFQYNTICTYGVIVLVHR